MGKSIRIGFILALAGFSALVATAGFKKREFSGDAVVQICAKDGAGNWQIVDELSAPLDFVFRIADAAGDKGLSTDFGFSGHSANGHAVSARLKSGASGNADATTGRVSLELPLDITVDGKKIAGVFKFTTESAQGAAGEINGRRAKIDAAARTAQLGMVSSRILPNPGVLFSPKEAAGKQELMIVISGNGILKAED